MWWVTRCGIDRIVASFRDVHMEIPEPVNMLPYMARETLQM
jgi:hypothetical protein